MRTLWVAFAALAVASCAASHGTDSTSRFLPQQHRMARTRLTPAACVTPTAPQGKTYFEVCKRDILISRNGKVPKIFYIKGVDYSPTQIGTTYIAPLDDANQAIWSKDLAQMRALGVNAVKVYNVDMVRNGPGAWSVAPMTKWLTAAYNGGNKPIYTILSISFAAGLIDNPPNQGAVTSLQHQYYVLAKTLGPNPDVMGISIGDEWNQHPFVGEAGTWTQGVDPIIQAAWQGLIDAGVGNVKILTTTLVDDLGTASTSTMAQGETYGFPPTPKPTGPPFNGATAAFAWGFDVYRGDNPPFFRLWSDVHAQTKHPFIISEWGEPVACHPAAQPQACPSASASPPVTAVTEYASPVPASITDYVDGSAATLYKHATISAIGPKRLSRVVSGGFYFEWSDENWKAYGAPTAAQACNHIGGNEGTNPNPESGFPSGFDDEAWFGLNAVSLPTGASCPAGSSSTGADVMTPRADFYHLQNDWKSELSTRRLGNL